MFIFATDISSKFTNYIFWIHFYRFICFHKSYLATAFRELACMLKWLKANLWSGYHDSVHASVTPAGCCCSGWNLARHSSAAFLARGIDASGNTGDYRWASPTCRHCGTSCRHHHRYTWQLLPVGSVTILWFRLPGLLCRSSWSAAKTLKATNIQMRKSRVELTVLVFPVCRPFSWIMFSSCCWFCVTP